MTCDQTSIPSIETIKKFMKRGWDTFWIANFFKCEEHQIWNALNVYDKNTNSTFDKRHLESGKEKNVPQP